MFGRTPLHEAAALGDVSALDSELLSGGVSAPDIEARDSWGTTPLLAAAGIGNEACVRALLDARASVEALSGAGATVLHAAAFPGKSPQCLQLLVAAGANPYAKDANGRTATDWASMSMGTGERRQKWMKDAEMRRKKIDGAQMRKQAYEARMRKPYQTTIEVHRAEECLVFLQHSTSAVLTMHVAQHGEEGAVDVSITHMTGEELCSISTNLGAPIYDLRSLIKAEYGSESFNLLASDGTLLQPWQDDRDLSEVLHTSDSSVPIEEFI